MGRIFYYSNLLTNTYLLLLPCFICVLCIDIEIPIALPPIESEILDFLDQRIALVYPIIQSFKNIIFSDPLGITNTWVGSDVCSYTGFYCDNPPHNLSATAIAAIDFNGFGLGAPSLDGFIDQLPDLAIFHANSNFFSGTISAKISQLPYLYEFDISNNNFYGAFPAAVLSMTGLSFLDIRFNYFTGSVPPQIFMQNLDVLFINNNKFKQNLPNNLGKTPVRYLTAANNKFTGLIPRSIGDASFTEVLLLNNLLTGCIPYEIGFLREATLLDIGNNLLTGKLPCSLGCLENIEQLNFAGNLLHGQVPEVVCKLESLVNFSLSYNYFTGVGPWCRKLIRNGVLDVGKNCIPYIPDQRSVLECATFFSHPRSCPHPNSYNLIPCKAPPSGRPPKRSKTPLVSYDNLPRHRL